MVQGADGGGSMAKLIGAQRMVLQAILDLPKDAAGHVTDSQIAQRTQIAITDVRNWIMTLLSEGYVDGVRATDGLRALLRVEGRLALGLYWPFGSPASSATQPSPSPAPTGVSSGTQHAPPAPSTAASPSTLTGGGSIRDALR